MACEVHLGCAPNRDSVDIFLTSVSSASNEDDAAATSSPTLFVWLEAPPEDGSITAPQEDNRKALVGDVLPERYAAAVAFCGGPLSNKKNLTPLQCITLQPSLPKQDDEEDDMNNSNYSTHTTLLQALQLYSRNLFLPAFNKVEGEHSMLQDKIMELSVAIGQSQRSAKLPTVVLQVDPAIVAAVAGSNVTLDNTNVDWNALGLSDRLQDDQFLNTLQAAVGAWIVQIRKLTVLPKSTPFPVIVDAATDANPPDLEEITFWSQLATGLQEVQEQLHTLPVEITLAMLREAKRYVSMHSRHAGATHRCLSLVRHSINTHTQIRGDAGVAEQHRTGKRHCLHAGRATLSQELPLCGISGGTGPGKGGRNHQPGL
jgi:hypothetical protein